MKPSHPAKIYAPTASMTCTGVYTLTQGDIDAGQVFNIGNTSRRPFIPSSARCSARQGSSRASSAAQVPNHDEPHCQRPR